MNWFFYLMLIDCQALSKLAEYIQRCPGKQYYATHFSGIILIYISARFYRYRNINMIWTYKCTTKRVLNTMKNSDLLPGSSLFFSLFSQMYWVLFLCIVLSIGSDEFKFKEYVFLRWMVNMYRDIDAWILWKIRSGRKVFITIKVVLKANLDKTIRAKSLQLHRFACVVIHSRNVNYLEEGRSTDYNIESYEKIHAGNIVACAHTKWG